MPKVALFDADGVLTLPEEIFSVVYTRSRGLDYAPFETFFTTEWLDFVTGKRDLKQHIAEHPEFWQWDGMPDDLIRYWCEVEDVRNQPLVALIAQLRASGTRCYLATEQEKYRAEYMQTVMFPGAFDGHFVTAHIGQRKNQPEFYQHIIDQLRADDPHITPADITFFDDSQSKIDTARAVGINAQLYKNVAQVEALLGSGGRTSSR